jgi:ribonuclease BN (tRNA processing enzyme)
MNLTVLGSGAAGGNSGSGCTGYLVNAASTNVLLDCGSGTVGELKRWVDIRSLDAIVISHMHLDHILDLVTLRAAFRYAPEPFEERIPLWLPPGGRAILDSLAAPLDLDHHSPLFFDQVYAVEEYNPIDSLHLGDIGIDFAPTQHPMPAWATRISSARSEGAFGYTADTGPITSLGTFLQGVDTLICEATLLSTDIPALERGHLTAAEAGRLATTCRARRLVLAHFWEELGPELLLAAATTTFDGPVELAWPGLEITA